MIDNLVSKKLGEVKKTKKSNLKGVQQPGGTDVGASYRTGHVPKDGERSAARAEKRRKSRSNVQTVTRRLESSPPRERIKKKSEAKFACESGRL